jgi:uncharacterized protein (TIGR02996 family)
VARYTLGKDVWEIEQVGNELHITAKGKPSVRKFVTAEQAVAQLAKLVAAQEAAGYRAAVSDRRHPDLERAIADAPEDPAGYAVYADWLESQGDPRGKLIAVQLAS